MALAAMQATQTVALTLDGLVVQDVDIASVSPATQWREADRLRTSDVGAHSFGLLAEIVRRLRLTVDGRGGPAAGSLADAFAAEGDALRTEAYRLVDEVPPEEQIARRLEVRAAALTLNVRAATALVTTGAGRAMAVGAPEQRLAREALFHLVQAQTPPIREATLRALQDPADRRG